jgi:hypothetical protein
VRPVAPPRALKPSERVLAEWRRVCLEPPPSRYIADHAAISDNWFGEGCIEDVDVGELTFDGFEQLWQALFDRIWDA